MELTAETTKVFGEEMATLISKKISEQELEKCASEAWSNLKRVDNW